MTAAKTVFTANCEVCHGADGTGSNPTGKALNAANLTSANVQKQSNVQLARFISEGRGAMPSFKSQLTHRQIMNQVQYIRSLAKEKK